MDYISNLITSVRNAEMASHAQVSVPATKIGQSIVAILKAQGYVASFTVREAKPQSFIDITLLKPRRVHRFRRISKPGRRVYVSASEIPRVLNGLGLAIISTSQGVLSGQEARKRKIGGEVLCEAY